MGELFKCDMPVVITAEPVTDIRRIAAVLSENKLDAMPIVEDTGICGVNPIGWGNSDWEAPG